MSSQDDNNDEDLMYRSHRPGLIIRKSVSECEKYRKKQLQKMGLQPSSEEKGKVEESDESLVICNTNTDSSMPEGTLINSRNKVVQSKFSRLLEDINIPGDPFYL